MNELSNPYEQERLHQLIPETITWRGPNGWRIRLDEDGPHLTAPKGDGLEWGEVIQLLKIIEVARKIHDGENEAPAPRPPEHHTWEQERAISDLQRAVEKAAQDQIKALREIGR